MCAGSPRGSQSWPVPGPDFKPGVRYFVSRVGSTPTGFRQIRTETNSKLTIFDFFRNPWQCTRNVVGRIRRNLISLPSSPVVAKINGTVNFEHRFLPFLDEDDFRAMLTGSYDLLLCDYLKRHVRPGDIVLDVGANVGYISATAASYLQPGGEVHGFEPLPECFARLERLRELNPQFRLTFNNFALGETDDVLPISYNPDGDSRNATLISGTGNKAGQVREVPVLRLDEYIRTHIPNPEKICLIKIDVEGFEYRVLRGLSGFFAENRCRPLIVCEVKPWELKRLGATPRDFADLIRGFGYKVSRIEDQSPVDLATMTEMGVLVFQP